MNCRQINHNLILGNIDSEMKSLLELLELADPGLRCLSPLARASWRLHSKGSVSREEAEAALAATFLIPGDDAEAMLAGEHILSSEFERVEHIIVVEVKTQSSLRTITLSFASEGTSQYNGDGPEWITVRGLGYDQLCVPVLTEDDIINAYETKTFKNSPTCYPCDTDFIGMPTYTLVSIADQPVSGPSLTDYYHLVEWIDQGFQKEPLEGREFSWLHQLTREQAETLGLARSNGIHPDPTMPHWLADDVDFSKIWISTESLQNSYSQGTVTSYAIGDLLLCLGAGPEWRPLDMDEQVDEVDEERDALDPYPETQLPIKVFSLAKGSLCQDPGATAALQLLDRLVKTCREWKM